MAQVADQLAVAVGTQWENEAAVRRLNDPWPLPVSWDAADPSLTDTWDSLARLAASGAGWPAPPPPGTWAPGPGDLAGKGGELVDVLARVPTGRLVVLGEPGAGKTVLMVRLVLDLLARRGAGGPVPFLASVASWDPSAQDLRTWLAARLVIDHPALAEPPPAGVPESTQASALLALGLILPVLDGLDEIPEQVRGPAISRINDALRPGEQLVATCRTQQYRDAVRPQGGPEVTLRATAAVQLRPLDANAVREYLSDDAAGPVARARWKPVLSVLGTEAPAGQALGTPLMVALARAIYNPRPGELAGGLHDPAELCSPALTDRAAVESLLFDAFIPSAYRHDPSGWKAQDAERWLVFLARHLEYTVGSPDLAWWQLRQAIPRIAFGLAAVLGIAFLAGLGSVLLPGRGAGIVVGFVAGLRWGLVFGLGLGLATMLTTGLRKRNTGAPSRGMRISVSGLKWGLGFGLGIGLAFGLTFGLGNGLGTGLGIGLGLGLSASYIGGLGGGLAASPGDPAAAVSPRAVLARDQRAMLFLMLTAGLGIGLAVGFAAWLRFGPAGGLGLGLAVGLVSGLLVSGTQTAWPSYMLTVGWLAVGHRLPRSLMSFLADAHQRGVLRQAGAVYQFRHIDLQHRLATRP